MRVPVWSTCASAKWYSWIIFQLPHVSLFVCDYGPIRTSDKIVNIDKFSVITNTLQVRMVCRDSTIFWGGQIFQAHRRQNSSRQKLGKIYLINKTVINLSIICRKHYHWWIWQLFDSFNIFSANATEETKICHDKICPLILAGHF